MQVDEGEYMQSIHLYSPSEVLLNSSLPLLTSLHEVPKQTSVLTRSVQEMSKDKLMHEIHFDQLRK